MAELIKQWADGGNLTATYEGSGNGSAIFSSDVNNGAERQMEVSFVDATRNIIVVRTIRQAAGEMTEATYTRLSHIKCTGEQYFNLGYVVKGTDTIESYFDATIESVDKFLYGAAGNNGSVWLSIYSTYAYVRFGQTESKSIGNGAINHYVKAKQKSVLMDATTTTLDYVGMPSVPLFVFAGNGGSNNPYNYYKGTAWMFKITDADGNVVFDLRPVKRDSDGKIGMLNLINGKFYINEGSGADFVGGTELNITNDYELIDRVAFNNNIAFDTGFYGNEQTYIDILFQRTDTSGADYLFGCSSGDRLTGYLTSSGYWRYGSAAPTFNTNSKKIYKAVVTPTKTTIDRTNSATRSVTEFTTSRTIPIGGYKSSSTSDTITRTYQGYIYYFKMRHGDNVLVDWYPCRRLSDGVEGFWDCVTETFVEPI